MSFLIGQQNKSEVFVIAEAGSTHNRSLSKIKKLIDVAANSGADAIKFQSFFAEEIATKNKKYNLIKGKFKRYSNNLFDFYKKLELPTKFYKEILKYCKKREITFLTSAFGFKSFNTIKDMVPLYKLASFEINYYELIDKMIKENKPIIFSTGCSHEKEIIQLVKHLKKKKFKKYALLHCGSSYPLKPEDANLNYILRLKKLFKNTPIGYSDHTTGISASIAAVSLGAKIIEKHFTISKKDKNPDSFFSLEPKELKEMVIHIREVEKALGYQKKFLNRSITLSRSGMRSYFAKDNYSIGHKLSDNMIIALRPYVKNSLPIDKIKNFYGRKLKKKIDTNQVLTPEHFK